MLTDSVCGVAWAL